MKKNFKRALSLFLSLALILTLLPSYALADDGGELGPEGGGACLCVDFCDADACGVCAADPEACQLLAQNDNENYDEGNNNGGGLVFAPACVCISLCDEDSINIACPVCAEDYTACEYFAACDCVSLCTEEGINDACPVCAEDYTACEYFDTCNCIDPCDADYINEECPVCAVNPALCTPVLLAQINPMSNPVLSDKADFDILLNVDDSYGVDPNELAELVKKYLAQLTLADNKTYRITTTAAQIDSTDLSKWSVYDHYDTAWYADETTWTSKYATDRGLGSIPQAWYYYKMEDTTYNAGNNSVVLAKYGSVAGKMTLEDMYKDGVGTKGSTAKLREHIYSYKDDFGKPAMLFYGYGIANYADFLYYPASKTSNKKVEFDVDAANVQPHSLRYAGFLINAGVDTKDTPGTSDDLISGYLLLMAYGPNNAAGGKLTDCLIGTYMYKLDKVKLDTLHEFGIRGGSGYSYTGGLANATNMNLPSISQPAAGFWKNSHIVLDITPTSINATMQQIDASGNPTGPIVTLADNVTVDDLGYGGFGPYCDYAVTWSHTCNNTSTFIYSNLQMSFAENLSGGSTLEAYEYADYWAKSENTYFVNLTDKDRTDDYSEHPSDLDLGYLYSIQENKTVLITDETGGYNTEFLESNSKDLTNSSDIGSFNSDMSLTIDNGSYDELAAKLAWLIYKSRYDSDKGIEAIPKTTVVAHLELETEDGSPANEIEIELIDSTEGIKVYLDTSDSLNVGTYTPIFTLTKPGKQPVVFVPLKDSNGYYIVVKEKDPNWPTGEYIVTLTYDTSDGDGSTDDPVSTECSASFRIHTDKLEPGVTVDTTNVSKGSVALTFTNSKDTTDPYAYMSALDKYAYVITTSATPPANPPASTIKIYEQTSTSAEIIFTPPIIGDYYIYTYVWDEAGNMHIKQTAIRVPSTSVAVTGYDASGGITLEPGVTPSTGATINDEDKVIEYRKVGDTNWIDSGWTPADGDYTLDFAGLDPNTEYEIRVRVKDTAGKESETIITFLTPSNGVSNGDSAGNGSGSAGINIFDKDGDYLPVGDYVFVVKYGDTIVAVASPHEDGTHSNFTETIENLPDGTYNVEVSEPGGGKVTRYITIKDGAQADALNIEIGDFNKHIRVSLATLATPIIKVFGLNGFYERFSGSNAVDDGDNNKGLTDDDNDNIVKVGSVSLIELIAEGVDENNPDPEFSNDVTSLQETAANDNPSRQTVLMIDLTLWKNILTAGVISQNPTQLIESGELITIIVPLPPGTRGTNFKAFRVHEGTPEEIPQAPNKNITTGEYCEFDNPTSPTSVTLHVKLFSLYSFTFVPAVAPPPRTSVSVSFNANGGSGTMASVTVPAGAYTLPPCTFTRDGYSFSGWMLGGTLYAPGTTVTLTGSVTLYAQWTPNGSPSGGGGGGGGGGGSQSSVTIPSASNGRITVNPSKPATGDSVTVTVTPNAGYRLDTLKITDNSGRDISFKDNGDGTFTYVQPSGHVIFTATFAKDDGEARQEFAPESDVSAWLLTYSHIEYMIGRPGDIFVPDANMTRAEAAQMFYNLLRDKNVPISPKFNDVPEDAWYTKAVNTLASVGIVVGCPDGGYHPDDHLTRAELAALVVRFAKVSEGSIHFDDVPKTHWAYSSISTAANFGWVEGVGNNRFEPDRNITRAEVSTLMNNVLRRYPHKDYIDSHEEELVLFYDLKKSHWAYYNIRETTNAHEYKMDGKAEIWRHHFGGSK